MPLYEFLRLAMEKLESSKQKPCSTETENDLVGRVTKNDKIMGRSPTAPTDGRVEYIFNDISPEFSNKDGTFPWFSNPASDDLQDYSSRELAETPGIGVSAKKFLGRDKGDYQVVMQKDRDFWDSITSSSADDMPSFDEKNTKKRSHDTDEWENELQNTSVAVKKSSPARRGCDSKKRRAAEVHSLSERRRRDRINQKMQTLQELVPNCNKADKASMLDEVIEYLKNLKHQVQTMSMGSGLCIPPLLFTQGTQHMYHPHMPHFSYSGVRMGTPRCPVFPIQTIPEVHFPTSPIGLISMQGNSGPFLPVCGHPGSVLLTGWPMRPSASPKSNYEALLKKKNSQCVLNVEAERSIQCTSNQLQSTTDVANQSNRAADAVRINRSSRNEQRTW